MIQHIAIKNPFEPKRFDTYELYYKGENLPFYVDCKGYVVVLDGKVIEDVEHTYPQDNSQIITMPAVGGKGLKKVLGFVAMIALVAYAGAVAAGKWAAAGATNSIWAAGSIASTLASGAIMFIGGKLINSIFPQQSVKSSYSNYYTQESSSPTYGWDTPQPQTAQGYCVGETYGECIPAPQLLSQHIETVGNNQYINLLYCGGMGPVDSISDIRISGTAIGNFTGATIETRLGTNDQKPISFFTNTPLDESVSVELSTANPVVRTSSSHKATSLECTLEWPGGLFYTLDNGLLATSTVTFRIEYKKTDSSAWKNFRSDDGSYSVSGAQTSAIRRYFRVDGLEPAQYDVRVWLRSRDTSNRASSITQWTLLTAYDEGIYSRPNKVLVALRILATNQLSGSVPQITWRQKRSTVYVYDPSKEAYVSKSADNPIWAAYDILHHARLLKNTRTNQMEYVVDGVSHDCFDAYFSEWESAAAYADEMIENQYGELEERFRFDAYFDTTQKRMDAAQKAATIGHAVIIPHGRNFGVVVDRPGKITQIFGEGRTTVSSVKGEFSSKDDRARAVEVTYNDTENDFTNTVLTVRSPNFNTSTSTDNTAQLSLFGVKRRSQAYREGIMALATNERQIQTLELSADIDAIVAEYGDIVGYSHTVSRIGDASGRVVAVNGNEVTLDREVELYADLSYEIYIQLATDVLVKRGVVAQDYKGNVITVDTAFDAGQIPEEYDNYSFGEAEKAVKPFRIVSASRSGDMLVQLKLAEYDEAIYATELDYSKYPVVDYTSTRRYAYIKEVTATENSYMEGGSAVSDVQVEWQLSSTGQIPDSYIVEIVSRSGSYTDRLSTQITSCLFHGVKAGERYDVTVKCVFDLLAMGACATMLYVQGIDTPEGNISGLKVYRTAGGVRISWNPPTGIESPLYQVWCEDEVIATGIEDTTLLHVPEVEGVLHYTVQTIDAEGVLQGTALKTLIDFDLPDSVKDASATALYRAYSDGTTGYDIVVTFTLPTNGDRAELYYKTNSTDMTDVTIIEEGTAGDEIGFLAEWKYAGDGTNRIVIPSAQVGDIYRLKLITKDLLDFSTPDADAVYLDIAVAAKTTTPETPQNFSYDFTKDFLFTWQDVTNADIEYYELRTNQMVGAANGLLGRTPDTSIKLDLTDRECTIYLYAKNTVGKYSSPAKVYYRVNVPETPVDISILEIPRGFRVTVPAYDSPIRGCVFYITGDNTSDRIESANIAYDYYGEAGFYSVQVSYYDLFGEGGLSPVYTAVVKPTFDASWIEDGSLSIEKMDGVISNAVQQTVDNATSILSIQDTITKLEQYDGEIKSTITNLETQTASQIQQLSNTVNVTVADAQNDLASRIEANADRITQIVGNLNNTDAANSAYSAIASMNDAINLRVQKGDVINQINLTAEGTTIDGKYLHVTGTTQFDDDVITNGMIQAGSITADKLSSTLISLQNKQGIQGGNVTLDASGMTVTVSNGTQTIFDENGMTFKDVNGNTFASVGRMMIGSAADGDYVKFDVPWDTIPKIFITQAYTPNLETSGYGQTVTKAYAFNVTEEGFYVRCVTGLNLIEGNSYTVGVGASANSTATYVFDKFPVDVTLKIHFYVNDWANYYDGTGRSYAYVVVDGVNVAGFNHQRTGTFSYLRSEPSYGDVSSTATYAGTIKVSHNVTMIIDVKANSTVQACVYQAGRILPTFSPVPSTIQSYEVISLSEDTVLATGEASFIAISGNNASYSIVKEES